MLRRRFLAVCSCGLSGLAGCQGGQGGETADRTTGNPERTMGDGCERALSRTTEPKTDSGGVTSTRNLVSQSPTPSPSPNYESDSPVEFDALQPGLIYLYTDQYDVSTEPDRQYLFLNVPVKGGSRSTLSDLVFRFDGDRFSPETYDGAPRYPVYPGEPYAESDDGSGGWVLFALPETGDASAAKLEWPGGEWRPGRGLRKRLSDPLPSLNLESWTVPETARLESVLSFEFTVENAGERAGRFLAGVNMRDPYRAVSTISRRIPPEETVSWKLDADRIESWFLADGPNEEETQVTYRLDWTGGHDSRTVTVESRSDDSSRSGPCE